MGEALASQGENWGGGPEPALGASLIIQTTRGREIGETHKSLRGYPL